jgi:hypothetical protein
MLNQTLTALLRMRLEHVAGGTAGKDGACSYSIT